MSHPVMNKHDLGELYSPAAGLVLLVNLYNNRLKRSSNSQVWNNRNVKVMDVPVFLINSTRHHIGPLWRALQTASR